ncbi:MAG: hypothetical protein KDG54_12905 [Geminicoccaceae bacterium]|nr:hypothetical protein [Geminicoccaceae bacterium]
MTLQRLHHVLDSCAPAAIALSGGVDSMTLGFIAHRRLPGRVAMFHAASAAVPQAATERIKAYAARENWSLNVVDAGELTDERYLANPANRCFFCKSNLYGTLASLTADQLLSGTNLDDLGDWRPGLQAAREHHVRHPFVEAEIDKNGVRALAASLGLDDLAELPAAPCLSSRIETGQRIDPEDLALIDRVETLLRASCAARTVRCRIRHDAMVIELDPADALGATARQQLTNRIRSMMHERKPVRFESYRRGSAFLRHTLDNPDAVP